MKSILKHGFAMVALIAIGIAPGYAENINIRFHTEKAAEAAEAFVAKDHGMKILFEKAYGFAIFPGVGEIGALGVAGAHGKGEVYEQGEFIGTASLTQATIGLALGVEKYREAIFFENKKAMDSFLAGNFEFGAQASAVVVKAGASASPDYAQNVAVYTMVIGGAMVEVGIGGQKFKFHRK